MRTWRIVGLPITGLFVLVGCGDAASDEEAPGQPMVSGTVSFAQPMDGAQVMGSTVEVVLETTGISVVEAGVMDPATGHHHLFLDADVTPMGEVIPAGVEGIIHKGDGTSVHTLEGVAPGEHRLIAVVGDGVHIPLDPVVTDTIFFTVAGGGGQD